MANVVGTIPTKPVLFLPGVVPIINEGINASVPYNVILTTYLNLRTYSFLLTLTSPPPMEQ